MKGVSGKGIDKRTKVHKDSIAEEKRVRKTRNGTKLEFFSPERIALNGEVREHPELMILLGKYKADDFEGKIGEIAAYCNIALDGLYTPRELDKVCEMCLWKLREKRVIVLN